MNDQIDWKEKNFSTFKMIERAIVLCMNRVEKASQREFNSISDATYNCEIGPHFDQECQTLINLLLTRQNLSPEYVDSPLPGEAK